LDLSTNFPTPDLKDIAFEPTWKRPYVRSGAIIQLPFDPLSFYSSITILAGPILESGGVISYKYAVHIYIGL
jgi:hypothetical protein